MQKLKTAIFTSAMAAAAISLGGCATRITSISMLPS